MLNMSAARPAVKYSVVNQAKELGDLSATPVARTVHKGKSVVAMFAPFSYVSKIFWDSDFASG